MKLEIIRRGSKGAFVKLVQGFLRGRGYSAVIADGDFGDKTHNAVVDYQRKSGLTADGVVGNSTINRMTSDGFAMLPVAQTSSSFPPKPPFSPLVSNAARAKVFGEFRYVSAPVKGNPENIRITDGWEGSNIVTFQVPQLGGKRVRLHRKVQAQFLGFFAAVEKAGMLDLVKTFDGAFVPRFVRGSRSTLSNHSFGSAFDINYEWNQLQAVPAAKGEEGSVRELVPLAHEYGFYWGGHFSRLDGMHFEVAVVLEPGERLSIDYKKALVRRVSV